MTRESYFGLAEIKEEGKPLWPRDYLLYNGRLPKKEIYSEEVLKQLYERGYTDEDFAS